MQFKNSWELGFKSKMFCESSLKTQFPFPATLFAQLEEKQEQKNLSYQISSFTWNIWYNCTEYSKK